MASCSGINCTVPCYVMGKHAIPGNLCNKIHTYHHLHMSGLFTTPCGLDLCFLSAGFMGSVFIVQNNLQHSLNAKTLVCGFIRGDSDLFKKSFILYSRKISVTFHGEFGNNFFSKLAISFKKEESGLRGSAAVWHLIFRAYYY